MAASSIQVTGETRERLKGYKLGGMTYEDVLLFFMDVLGPEEFHDAYRKWQARVAGEVRRSKKWRPFPS